MFLPQALSFLARPLEATPASTVGVALLRLAVAAGLGALIGIEREIRRKPAGLRTNMFLCFGCALFTILSALMAGSGQDKTRIAAQIIAGIGFIGAGAILHPRTGQGVSGVTTASTIFVVAAIGMCVGAGLMFPAVLASTLVLFGLLILGIFEKHVFVRPHTSSYSIHCSSRAELDEWLDFARSEPAAKLVEMKLSAPAEGGMLLEFTLEARPELHRRLRERLVARFGENKAVSFHCSEQE